MSGLADAMSKHPSHKTRASDASSYDEVCEACGATDISGGGWGKLAEPCPAASPPPSQEGLEERDLAKQMEAATRDVETGEPLYDDALVHVTAKEIREAAAALSRLRADLEAMTASRDGYVKDAAARASECDRLRAETRELGDASVEWQSRAEKADATVTRLTEALTEARKIIQTRQTLDEMGWGRGTSPVTPVLERIDAALRTQEKEK